MRRSARSGASKPESKELGGRTRYVVWLVDPGPDRPGVLRLLQEVSGASHEAAAELLSACPCPLAQFPSEAAARDLTHRFREFDAVAVVRPIDMPLAPAPVEEVDAAPAQRAVRVMLIILAVAQLLLGGLWLREGRTVAGACGLLLGLCVLAYLRMRG